MNVSATNVSNAPTQASYETQAQNVLGKDDFLRLLTVQLRYQDPTNPVKDQDFIAQLAQFSALEQTQNLANQMQRFIDLQISYALTAQSAALLGRTVEVYVDDTGETVKGKVEAVRLENGLPEIVVNGKTYPLGSVVSVL